MIPYRLVPVPYPDRRRCGARRAALAICALLIAPFGSATGTPRGKAPSDATEGWSETQAVASAETLGQILAELERLGARVPVGPDPQYTPRVAMTDPGHQALIGDEPGVRELLLHARSLWRKAEHLARERGRARAPSPELPSSPVRLADLIPTLDATLDRLVSCRPGQARAVPMSLPGIEAGELLAALRSAQLACDALRSEPPGVGDVHWATTRALAFASSLRARWPGRRMPQPPPTEADSTQREIYATLLLCWERTEELMRLAGWPELRSWPVPELEALDLERLHSVASLLADELELLQLAEGDPELLPPACHPGPRGLPDLSKRVRTLDRQLENLTRLTRARGGLSEALPETP